MEKNFEQNSERHAQKRHSLRSSDSRSISSHHTTISVEELLEIVEQELSAKGKNVVDSKVAYTLSDLGEQFRTEGDYTQAAAYLKEALTMYSKLDGKEKEVVQVRNKLGLVYIKQSNFRLAESSLEEALKDAVEKSPEQADAYYYLGLMHRAQQSYAEATDALQQALTIFETLDNSGYVARMRYHLGLVYLAQNQHALAEQSLKYALTALPTDSEDNDELAEAWHNLGLAQQALEKYPDALASFQLALELDEKQHQIGLTHYHMGTVYLMQNKPSSAIASFTEALATFGEDNEHVAVTEVRLSLGLAERASDNLPNALEHWNIALTQYLTINDDLKYNSKIKELLTYIGLAYQAQGHFNYAIASFERILYLYEELGVANETVAATHHLMGETYLDDHAMEAARESLTKALEMYQTLNRQTEINTVQGLLSIANQTTTPEADTAALNSSPNIGEQKDPLCCCGFFTSSWSFFSNPQTNSGLPASVKTPLIPTVATVYGSSSLG